jgi:hypothetical protein
MGVTIRPPDDVYWRFRRMPLDKQVGAECLSKEDGCLYRVRPDRSICRVVEGVEQDTIDSLPLKPPLAARIMTGANWGFHLHISTFYQQVIGPSGAKRTN